MLLENEDECEVDPTKMQPGGNLQHNKEALVKLVKKAWLDILSSYTKFPRLVSCDCVILSCDGVILSRDYVILSHDCVILSCDGVILSCDGVILSCDGVILSCDCVLEVIVIIWLYNII